MAEGAEAISFNAIQFILSNGTRNHENYKTPAMFNVKKTNLGRLYFFFAIKFEVLGGWCVLTKCPISPLSQIFSCKE